MTLLNCVSQFLNCLWFRISNSMKSIIEKEEEKETPFQEERLIDARRWEIPKEEWWSKNFTNIESSGPGSIRKKIRCKILKPNKKQYDLLNDIDIPQRINIHWLPRLISSVWKAVFQREEFLMRKLAEVGKEKGQIVKIISPFCVYNWRRRTRSTSAWRKRTWRRGAWKEVFRLVEIRNTYCFAIK